MPKKDGGGGSAKDYYGTIAGLVCAGPVDELSAIIVDGKTVWDGPATRTGPGATNPMQLTVAGYGTVIFYWGTSDQTVNTTLTPSFSSHPPYRRQCWAILKDFLFGRERTSAPNVEFVVRRKPQQSVVTGDAAELDDDHQANPLAVLAEVVTDPVFGLGQVASLLDAPSVQSTADALTAEAARTHLSPVLDRGASFRVAAAELLTYFDGWLRWSATGTVESGRFSHNEAPPAFTSATTIDFHDLIEEIEYDADGLAQTSNETVVRFTDRARAFKDGAARAVSSWNRDVVGEPRVARVEMPFITRAQQAADFAAEAARIAAIPGLSGTLTVRETKATAIRPGDLFLLTHDAVEFSVVCRCVEKTFSAPDAGRVSLRFAAERGIAPVPYQPTPAGLGGPQAVIAERIDLFQIAQVPPALAGGDASVRLVVLAARTDPLSVGIAVHMQKDDGAGLFYELGTQIGWAVTGTLAQDYASTLPAAGTNPPDDDTETLHVTLDPATVPADLTKISTTQSADAVNDSAMLVWVFRDADPSEFEVMALKAIRIVGGDGFYRLKVRRARFGTSQLSFTTGDRAFIIPGPDLTTYGHSQFPAYAAAGATVTFRLQSFTAWGEAELADTAVCPDRTFTFADPYAPEAAWVSVKRNGTEVADFGVDFALTDDFALTVQGTDPNADLVALSVVARLGTEARNLLSVSTAATGTLTRSVTFRPSNATMSEGDWKLFVVVQDATGRKTEVQMTPGGGGSPVTLRLRAAPGADTACIAPVASPGGGAVLGYPFNVTLTTSTAGASIEYQIRNLGQAASGTWSTYASPVTISGDRTLYARAKKAGLTDSPTVSEDYWREPDQYLPPGYLPN